MSEDYAESVAIVGMSMDGRATVSGRLARFPVKGVVNLWLTITSDTQRYSVAEELSLQGFRGRSDVDSSRVEFMQPGGELAWFVRRGLKNELFCGSAVLRACAFPELDPPVGTGSLRVGFHAEFAAKHVPVVSRTGRMEVFGTVSVAIDLPDSQVTFDGLGKWHEQVGPRPRFGAAFTYMSVQMPSVAILARSGRGGSWGFVVMDGGLVAVKRFWIEPPGEVRRFELELADGRVTSGTTRVRWSESMPVEGLRRAGSFVDVECDLGHLMGHLNDWDPQD